MGFVFTLTQALIHTCRYLKAEIVKKFFLPFTLVSFGIVGYFHLTISQYNVLLSDWIALIDSIGDFMPSVEEQLEKSVLPSETSAAHVKPSTKPRDISIGDDSDSIRGNEPLVLGFLSLPSSKQKPSAPVANAESPTTPVKKKTATKTLSTNSLTSTKANTSKGGDVDSIFSSLLSRSGHSAIKKKPIKKKVRRKINKRP